MLETSMGEKSQRVQKAHRSQACQPDGTTVVRKGELLITANGSSNFGQRVSMKNRGEAIFEEYCLMAGYKVFRLGFDETNNNVTHFYKVNPLLRNIPDFLIDTGKENFVVQVKGTANLKKSEVGMIPLFLEWYSSRECPLVYAFCFDDRPKPRILYPENVIKLYDKSEIKKWPDGVEYRTLDV